MNSGKGGGKEKMTMRDIALIKGLKKDGVSYNFIAHYVYGITASTLKHHLDRWSERWELQCQE